MSSLILATFNIKCFQPDWGIDPGSPEHWTNTRAALCREVIRQNRFDVFGVQEAFQCQMEDLVRDSEYDAFGGGREDFLDKGEKSAILYKKDRFDVLESGTFGLSEHPEIPGFRSWNTACPRIATWGHFRDRQTGREFVYYNTHLDHESEQARINGIKLIVEHAKANVKNTPLILTGDFNTEPGSPTYLTAASLLHDSRDISKTSHEGGNVTWHNWGKNKDGQPIDFIFVSDGIEVLSHRTITASFDGIYPSDHYPLAIEFSIG